MNDLSDVLIKNLNENSKKEQDDDDDLGSVLSDYNGIFYGRFSWLNRFTFCLKNESFKFSALIHF